MKQLSFTAFALKCITSVEGEGRYSTGHLYRNALRSYTEYLGSPTVLFSDFRRDRLRLYEQWLSDHGRRPNTVSTYMRMLRSLYNKGVDAGLAPYSARLFHDVYTGIDTSHKKALPRNELRTLLYGDPGSDTLRLTQCMARLLYQLCGIPFVDLAHLRESDIREGVLEYRRMKTGTKVSVKILSPVADTMRRLSELRRPCRAGNDGNDGYVLGILSSDSRFRSREGYSEYQSALRRFNLHLGLLGRALGLSGSLSSYSLRHSWATTAKHTGASIEMISESLGHKSIRTTQTYLSGFTVTELARVNRKACSYAAL
jgi:integrase/recombinase XerD